MTGDLKANLYTELVGSMGYVIIDRPDSKNAMTQAMWDSLLPLCEALKVQGAKVIIIKSTGKIFCAGADLHELTLIEDEAAATSQWMSIKKALDGLKAFSLPTIAQIQGACLGGGCLLAMACDLRYAGKPAWFSVPIAKLGIVLDDANIARMISLLGPAKAKEMLYTAGTISSAEAGPLGLVNKVVEEFELASYVEDIAAMIVANGAVSILETKNSVARILNQTLPEGALSEYDHQSRVVGAYLSDDFRARISKNENKN